ncbi:uncharacterized protein BT62DRAFT_934183 [Guyanagaster necrorhizus]|uniref:Uncharacterized protein n=1 Tax=Guyanagaster necrorhizus TaxID=856835 RepID=A0A9P7VNN3_9AGAR|nr:uncharacterized protein BT62DRAFT_934183 [Guyanagaster necrorhizus MCA 3950]KAG7444541.1 hypothetical protein BT62DRAFT_934183 [Guyanagaster necrorhizus MCA 3950]
MQIASHGARAAARDVSAFFVPKLRTAAARSIHVSAHPNLLPPGTSTGNTARRILSTARQIASRFYAHLTAPGLGVHRPSSVARSIHGGGLPGRIPSIQQRMSHSVRYNLSRPLQHYFIPRGPVVPRTITQVGLGTARNFSSGRVLFENFAQNVPVTGRAFCEVDWEIKMRREKEAMKKTIKHDKKKAGGKLSLKAKENKFVLPSTPALEPTVEAEIEHYFPAPPSNGVTTSLLIPLAPTPTERTPLPPDTSPHQSLLPLPKLSSIHTSHELHSLRVSSLFARLDVANVWERGVQCSAYANRADANGVCTILKVEFVGWTKAEVRSVIGESGSGWCVLEELRTIPEEDEDDAFSDTSSVFSGISGECEDQMEGPLQFEEPTGSFILPTVDFSSSFITSRAPSDFDMFSDVDSDIDMESLSDVSASVRVDPLSTNGWYLFSSDFSRRANDRGYQPMETRH